MNLHLKTLTLSCAKIKSHKSVRVILLIQHGTSIVHVCSAVMIKINIETPSKMAQFNDLRNLQGTSSGAHAPTASETILTLQKRKITRGIILYSLDFPHEVMPQLPDIVLVHFFLSHFSQLTRTIVPSSEISEALSFHTHVCSMSEISGWPYTYAAIENLICFRKE